MFQPGRETAVHLGNVTKSAHGISGGGPPKMISVRGKIWRCRDGHQIVGSAIWDTTQESSSPSSRPIPARSSPANSALTAHASLPAASMVPPASGTGEPAGWSALHFVTHARFRRRVHARWEIPRHGEHRRHRPGLGTAHRPTCHSAVPLGYMAWTLAISSDGRWLTVGGFLPAIRGYPCSTSRISPRTRR